MANGTGLLTEYATSTTVGLHRSNNEDYACAIPAAGIFVVADGMGGHASGEVASRLAAEALSAWCSGHRDEPPGVRLRNAVADANRSVLERAAADRALQGMGTTVVALLVDGGWVHVCHVGDSRAYRLRGRRLDQLTKDHGIGNLLLRAIGHRTAEPDVSSHPIEDGDVFLLCTDGLTHGTDNPAIGRAMAPMRQLDQMASGLTELADSRGGQDNTTVTVVRCSHVSRGKRTSRSRPGSR